jgi:RNA polymerase sigma factor (sigma-70 family)
VMKRFTQQSPEGARVEFSLAFSRNFADICRFVATRSSSADVEAIVSEAFLVAWKQWPNRPERHDELRPWLYGITRNIMRSSLRHEKVRLRLEAPSSATQGPSNDGFERVESDLVMRAALMALSPDDREVILLVAWDDLDTSGLAIALGISKTAARVRLHRARKRLASEFAKSAVTKSTLHQNEVTLLSGSLTAYSNSAHNTTALSNSEPSNSEPSTASSSRNIPERTHYEIS